MEKKTAYLVVHNANIITMDPLRPRAQLIAVEGERITWVGAIEDLEIVRGPRTQIIDCQGKTVVPGFHDAHCHIMAYAATFLSVDCSPASVSSIADIQSAVRQRAATAPEGSWIRATGYNEFYLAEKRHPTRWDLDQAAPDHPVKLTHRTGHACVLNSLGLSLVGIGIEMEEPPGGTIERDLETGEPNGLLLEMDAYLSEKIPPLTDEELRKGVKLASQTYLTHGITSLQDATASNGLAQWQTLRRLRDSGELVPRVRMMVGIDALSEFTGSCSPDSLRDSQVPLGAVKIVVDEGSGTLYPSQAELEEQVFMAHRAGLQVAVHAVEEGAVEAAARALLKALHEFPRENHRHRVEHCSVCPPSVLKMLKEAQVMIVTQPSFLYYNGERYLAEVPEAQLRWLYRIKSFHENGLMPAASSDSPVVPVDPLVGVYAAVTRRAETGQVLSPGERISPHQALWMYTVGGAHSTFEEEAKGSIAVGKTADFAILSHDPTQVPAEEIKEIKVEMAVLGGKVVWERS